MITPCETHLDVSENSGTPKSSILIGFSIINHPCWGTPIFGNIHLYIRPFIEGFYISPHSTKLDPEPIIVGKALCWLPGSSSLGWLNGRAFWDATTEPQPVSLGSILVPQTGSFGMYMYFAWVFHKILQNNTGRGHKSNSRGLCLYTRCENSLF